MNRTYKIISIAAIFFIGAALILVGWRAYHLLSQLNSELKIDNLYNPQSSSEKDKNAFSNIDLDSLSSRDVVLEDDYISSKFEALLEENSDTVGWLEIPNTRIDHVVLQGDDNIFYLEHDFFGHRSVSACMMLDSLCNIDLIEKHYVIYGHRMKSGTMMNDILKYEEEDFFYGNPLIKFDTIYKSMQWEVFSTYCCDYDFNNTQILFDSNSEWLSYIEGLQKESYYETDIVLKEDDIVLTLYTCDYRFDGARYVIHARLIK